MRRAEGLGYAGQRGFDALSKANEMRRATASRYARLEGSVAVDNQIVAYCKIHFLWVKNSFQVLRNCNKKTNDLLLQSVI